MLDQNNFEKLRMCSLAKSRIILNRDVFLTKSIVIITMITQQMRSFIYTSLTKCRKLYKGFCLLLRAIDSDCFVTKLLIDYCKARRACVGVVSLSHRYI